MRQTKIIATIGPASNSPKIINALIKAGVDVFRFNLSHSTQQEHKKTLKLIRSISLKLNKEVGILFDLAGPKLRVGLMSEPVVLKKGQVFTLTKHKIIGDSNKASVNQEYLIDELKINDNLSVNEGQVELKVNAKTRSDLICSVKQSGIIDSNKGINVKANLSISPLTRKDYIDIHFAIAQKADWLALSFVRRKEDIVTLRNFLKKNNSDIAVMAKIEKKEAVKDIDAIIQNADGIMIARGDLGIEVPLEDVPIIQKIIIKKCMQKGKIVVTATQMLESMINNPSPTRAEANDIANAIFDQTDAVMMSGETAIGKYPLESLKTMAKIAKKTESALDYGKLLDRKAGWVTSNITDAISFASCELAKDLSASLLVTATQSGAVALRASAYRCPTPILAITPDQKIVRKLKVAWGIVPRLIKPSKNINEMLLRAKKEALLSLLAKKNDRIIITAGAKVNIAGTTNLIKVEVI